MVYLNQASLEKALGFGYAFITTAIVTLWLPVNVPFNINTMDLEIVFCVSS